MDKATKKAIDAVVKKYVNKGNMYVVPGMVSGVGALGIYAIAADLFTTGGAMTSAYMVASSLSFSVTGGLFLFRTRTCARANAAGQTLHCNEPIDIALGQIERNLKSAFNVAVKVTATPQEKEVFLSLAALSRQEVATLSPMFKIVSGGPRGFDTEKLALVVDVRDEGKVLVTLDDACALVQGKTVPPRNPAAGFRL